MLVSGSVCRLKFKIYQKDGLENVSLVYAVILGQGGEVSIVRNSTPWLRLENHYF